MIVICVVVSVNALWEDFMILLKDLLFLVGVCVLLRILGMAMTIHPKASGTTERTTTTTTLVITQAFMNIQVLSHSFLSVNPSQE